MALSPSYSEKGPALRGLFASLPNEQQSLRVATLYHAAPQNRRLSERKEQLIDERRRQFLGGNPEPYAVVSA